ncbi:MAG: hypothetical protein JWO05_711 [Gemmatimonadetes bacterium]|nr:hypothetical protein [Gemmatimonadota bacterium]
METSREVVPVLLIGRDEALLEGLAQSLASAGFSPRVAGSLAEARQAAGVLNPLLAVIDRDLVQGAEGEVSSLPLAPGGSLLLYRTVGSLAVTLSASLLRGVMADLTLPLERQRLLALANSVRERSSRTGRGRITPEKGTPSPERHTPR